MSQPLVSLISPCYNAEKYIKKLLDSVLRQDYEAIEFIIVDDGSTDNSLKIIEGYKGKFKKRGISYRVISKENGGAASAINKGLEVFTGDYIAFIDADDFLNDSSLRLRVDYLENNKSDEVVYSSTAVVNELNYGKIIKVKRETSTPPRKNLFIDMLKENNYIWTHAYMIRSEYFLKVHPTRHIEEFTAGQNIQLFLPVWHRASVGYIDTPTVTIVEHGDSHSRIARSEQEKQDRNDEIEEIYLNTLDRINLTSKERNEYKKIIMEKHQAKRKRVFQKISSNKDELGQLYEYDEQKFRNSYVADVNTANQSQLEAKMIFSSHSIEKSLSNDNFEIGHGFRVSERLINILTVYKKRGYNLNSPAYINTLSVLRVFYKRHEGTEFSRKIEDIFSGMYEDIVGCRSDIGGADTVLLKDKKNNHKKNFKDLSEGRFAVRMYADTPVDRSDIKEAVQIAMKTPTVCNRQSIRVYEMYDKDLIQEVLKVQGGIAYYDTPPVLLLVTANDNGYVGTNERNQGFIDGGLFAMSLLYAFEYKGLAACPLHAMFKEVGEKSIRGMLDLPDSDKLITFISVGHFKETNNVCKSFRYGASHILHERKSLHEFTIEEPKIEHPAVTPKSRDSIADTIRKKVRIRTRLRNLKHKTRIRTRAREYMRNRWLVNEKRLMRGIVNSPDGAILTLTGYVNYGNILQRYALQRFLLKHNYRFISYAQEVMDTRGNKQLERFKYTIPFVQQRITRKPFEEGDEFKYYITGSDQVWRRWDLNDTSFDSVRYYFFNFLKGSAKRISYGASFGHSDIEKSDLSKDFMLEMKPLVDKMSAMSVREKSGVAISKKWWNVEPEVVVDPTLLLSKADYDRLIDVSTVKLESNPDGFAYIIDSSKTRAGDVEVIFSSANIKYKSVYLKEEAYIPPVEQWLKNIRDAKLVVTDSFHGVVFSIINNTPFVVLHNKNGGISRVKDLLSELGLENRLLNDDSIADHNVGHMKPIDWHRVNRIMKTRVRYSKRWLLGALRDSGR